MVNKHAMVVSPCLNNKRYKRLLNAFVIFDFFSNEISSLKVLFVVLNNLR